MRGTKVYYCLEYITESMLAGEMYVDSDVLGWSLATNAELNLL